MFSQNASGRRLFIHPLADTRENVNRNTGIIALLLQRHDDIDDNVYDVESVEPPHDEKIYKLFHILRVNIKYIFFIEILIKFNKNE